MFKHYLKMAIRQILKNKIQYLLSIIGIAVGLLCFSMTSYYIRRFNNQFIAWANSDRMANIYAKSAQYGYEDPYIPGEVVQELMGNPITGIGQIAYSYGYGQANISISKENQKEIPYQCSIQNVTKDFPTIFGIQTLEGQTPTLKPGEVFISESSAKKIFGAENPIGKTLYFSRADSDTSAIHYSTISAVIGIFRMGHGKRVTFISWKQPASNQNVNTEIWWSCWIRCFKQRNKPKVTPTNTGFWKKQRSLSDSTHFQGRDVQTG